MAKHLPDLAEDVAVAIGDKESGDGVVQGRNQFMEEKRIERMPSWLKKSNFEQRYDNAGKQRDKNNDRWIDL